MDAKEKLNSTFLRSFDNLLSKYLIYKKSVLLAMAILGY